MTLNSVDRMNFDLLLEADQKPGFRRADRPAPTDEPKADVLAKSISENAQRHENVLQHCRYEMKPDGSVHYFLSDNPAFVDQGNHLLMQAGAASNQDAVLAALLVAKEKFGAIELTGSSDFIQFALNAILHHKIDVRLKDPQQNARVVEMRRKSQVPTDNVHSPTKSAVNEGVPGDESLRAPTSSLAEQAGRNNEAVAKPRRARIKP